METLGPHPTISGATRKARSLGWLSAGGRLIKHAQTFSVHLLSEGQVYMLSDFLETMPPFQALENYSQSRSPLKSLAGPDLLPAHLTEDPQEGARRKVKDASRLSHSPCWQMCPWSAQLCAVGDVVPLP